MEVPTSEYLNSALPKVWATLGVPGNLACTFFAVHSRLEFALKATRFAFARRGHAAADWKSFKQEVAAQYSPGCDPELDTAIKALIRAAPRRQLVTAENRAVFCEEQMPSDELLEVEVAIDYANRVRNNLFHGGKYFGKDAASRDEELVRLALIVLIGSARLLSDVEQTFIHGDG